MHGWHGTVIHIDLQKRTFEREHPPRQRYEDFLGGRGLAGWYLAPHVTLPWDDPALPVCIFAGPLTDTPSPASAMATIMSRSPLSGAVCDTQAGASFGVALKRAGIDGIVITGRGDRLYGIEIDHENVRFVNAEPLCGARCGEVLRATERSASALAIGPAAENGVRYAAPVIKEYGIAGRGGLGAVFAAKNCKYITVQGHTETRIADPERLAHASDDVRRLIAASPVLLGELGMTNFGSGALYDLIASRRMMPTGNFRRTFFDQATACNAHAYARRYAPRARGCGNCHIRCLLSAADGRLIPEYDAMAHFSALLENADIETVMAANHACLEMGLDPVSTAATLAARGESENRMPHRAEICRLIEDIGCARCSDTALGLGAARWARLHGCPEIAMTVKQQELPAFDPRGALGMAIAYATSTRGGCYRSAQAQTHEIIRKPAATDRFTFSGKARIIKAAEDMYAAAESLTVCTHVLYAATLEEYASIYSAVTGERRTSDQLLQAGERIYYHERMMNARNGFARADDELPARFFEAHGSSGNGIVIPPLSRGDFQTALDRYYRIRGLDSAGMPTAATARRLGLPWNNS
jgi:aldehyde:ferredoxin oxidoreductase